MQEDAPPEQRRPSSPPLPLTGLVAGESPSAKPARRGSKSSATRRKKSPKDGSTRLRVTKLVDVADSNDLLAIGHAVAAVLTEQHSGRVSGGDGRGEHDVASDTSAQSADAVSCDVLLDGACWRA